MTREIKMRRVAVIGTGMTKWGELWDKSLRDIAVETALLAMDDAGTDKIESMYTGCMTGGLFVGQEHLASVIPDYLGLTPISSTRVESACASGGLAVRQAFIDVASGMHDIVLAIGVEKMTDVGGDEATYALATAADQDYEVFNGVTFPGLYAMMAMDHMNKYGTTREQLAKVAVKNHEHGSKNPLAQFPQKITVKNVLESVLIADPLRILDCSPITDGSAAVIVCPLDMAEKYANGRPIVEITGTGHGTDTIALHCRDDLSYLKATEVAAKEAYKMAGKTPEDLDLVEVHDCFTIAEIMVTEALGLFEKGQGGKAIDEGLTNYGGKIPVNVSGGLKSKGHPVGATGVAQIYELVKQLRGDGGERQVEGAKVGMTQNMGGSGGSTVCHILEVR